MRGVQEVACVRQQDEVRGLIAVSHVSQSFNLRAGEGLGAGGHRARMIPAEHRPLEHGTIAGVLC